MKRALVFGVSGQDGAYLSDLLLRKGYEVHGTSRDAELQSFARLDHLGIRDRVKIHSASMHDFRSLLQLIAAIEPEEIYNLAGQTSVALSFSQPFEAIESIANAQLLLLEVLRFLGKPIRLYNASSSESFGTIPPGTASDETTPFMPRSPYATAKSTAHWLTANYREAYGLFACSGILFNHESPLRPERFVTRKVVKAAVAITAGKKMRLALGDVTVVRDWGYAPEFAEAMWLMLQQDHPDDYVIATGEAHTLEDFLAMAFESAGLDWREHVDTDPTLFRTSDIRYSRGNPTKARNVLGWHAKTKFADLVRLLVNAERESVARVDA
ncbi:MAG TPA: GDP-mannose 4,6-dehydratase [Thermoanaerobaculia bacterium]|nr:GDP-mannose 4,6-dehydratase [Thermoanaerobaculia bacterium]